MKFDNFVTNGFVSHPDFFDKGKCAELMRQALATRRLEELFLSQSDYEQGKTHKGTNPRPGRNLIGKLDADFIFGDERFAEEMSRVCGKRWRVLDYKFVMGIPKLVIPDWLNAELGDRRVSNLGAYVKPHYRDITYFRGIDFHQDIIDFPDRQSDFITVYIYLDTVTDASSPLYVFPDSHSLGASVFPHRLEKRSDEEFIYSNDLGDTMPLKLLRLTGGGGSMYYWHCNTLHGTQPHINDEPRISVRILIEKNAAQPSDCWLDEANKRSKGNRSLITTRNDLSPSGEAIVGGNFINKSI